jgi:hypothetical protein
MGFFRTLAQAERRLDVVERVMIAQAIEPTR